MAPCLYLDADVLNNIFEEENKEEDEKKKTARRKLAPRAKINEALLMGPKGIRLLEEMCQSFKPDSEANPVLSLLCFVGFQDKIYVFSTKIWTHL